MKYLLIIIIVSASLASKGQTVNFEKLKLNAAPAYVLLGVEPENIQRPSSPQQFIAGVQNAIVDGKLKPNVAIETTPYYWKNKTDSKKFNPSDYLLEKKNIGQSIAKTFTFSLATSESDSATFGKLKKGTGLGAGIRFTIVEGQAKKGTVAHLKKWNEALIKNVFVTDMIGILASRPEAINLAAEMAAVKNSLSLSALLATHSALSLAYSEQVLEELIAEINNHAAANSLTTKSSMMPYLTGLAATYNATEGAELAEINHNKVPFTKTGFMLELAAGTALVFQNNEWDDISHAKTGIWMTPSYRWEVTKDESDNISLIDLIGVVRFMANNKADKVDTSNYLDIGIKGQFTHNRWSGAVEGVYRYASKVPASIDKNYTYRVVANFDYKLNDLLTFKLTFGTNFDGNTATYTDPKKMFAVGGLNLGIFDSKK